MKKLFVIIFLVFFSTNCQVRKTEVNLLQLAAPAVIKATTPHYVYPIVLTNDSIIYTNYKKLFSIKIKNKNTIQILQDNFNKHFLGMSLDGNILASANNKYYAFIKHKNQKKALAIMEPHGDQLYLGSMVPHRKNLIIANRNSITIYNHNNFNVISKMTLKDRVKKIKHSPDGRQSLFTTAGSDTSYIYIYDHKKRKKLVTLKTNYKINDASFNVKNNKILLAVAVRKMRPDFSVHNRFDLRNAQKNKLLWSVDFPFSRYGFHEITACAIHPTRPLVAIGAANKKIYILNLFTGKRLYSYSVRYIKDSTTIFGIYFTPDGKKLIVGIFGSFLIWNI